MADLELGVAVEQATEPSPSKGPSWLVIAYVLITLAVIGGALVFVIGFPGSAGAAGDCGGG